MGRELGLATEANPRSYRDTKATAIEGAEFLKGRVPHSQVVVRDMQSEEMTAVAYKSGR